jgi:uncharacterized protein YdhG (YjbR/CyaY superfamily)
MAIKFDSVDAYLASLSGKRRTLAEQLRRLIAEAVPESIEAVKYDMPSFQIRGKPFLYFAVWKEHAGLYPIYRGDAAFEARIGPYRAEKDTVRFKLADALPEALVIEIARNQAARLSG